MKLPSVTTIRLPVLLLLIASEVAGLFHFNRTPNLILFTLVAIAGTTISAALLWIEWTESHGLTNQDIVFASFFVEGSIEDLARHRFVFMTFDLVIILIFLLPIIYPKLGRLISAKAANEQSQAGMSAAFGPFVALLISLFILSSIAGFFSDRGTSIFWTFPFLLPTIWYAWRYAVERIERKRINPDGNLSIVNRAS